MKPIMERTDYEEVELLKHRAITRQCNQMGWKLENDQWEKASPNQALELSRESQLESLKYPKNAKQAVAELKTRGLVTALDEISLFVKWELIADPNEITPQEIDAVAERLLQHNSLLPIVKAMVTLGISFPSYRKAELKQQASGNVAENCYILLHPHNGRDFRSVEFIRPKENPKGTKSRESGEPRDYNWSYIEFENGKWIVGEPQEQEPISYDPNDNSYYDEFGFILESFDDDPVFVSLFDVDDRCFPASRPGQVRLFSNCGGSFDFEVDDIRDEIQLPAFIDREEAEFRIITSGDGEDDTFEWIIIYPVE